MGKLNTVKNGKGDFPRNLGKKFIKNYDDVDWNLEYHIHEHKKSNKSVLKYKKHEN